MLISPQTDKILPALAKVKSELGAVVKKEDNPFFRSKYATLNAHIEVVEPLLQKYGLVMLQPCNNAQVETVIYHAESGQFVKSVIALILTKNDMQQLGSACSYGRRYTLGALLAMRAEDDDGNLASGNEPSFKKVESKPAQEATAAPEKVAATVSRPTFRKKQEAAKAEAAVGTTSTSDDL